MRSNAKPVERMTSVVSTMATEATKSETLALRQKRAASGSAITSVEASMPASTRSPKSAPQCVTAALDDIVLLRFEPDPQRQSDQPFAQRFGDGHAAAGAAVLQPGGRAVQRHIVEHRVYVVAPQGLDEAPASRSLGQDQEVGVGVG